MKSAWSKGGLIIVIISILQTAELDPEGIQQFWFALGSVVFIAGDWSWKT